jgi:drug/metabolite transporter (DMT)-like permease
MGWRNGGYASVLLVAVGAAMWGTDGILRVPLLEVASPSQIVLLEHLVLLLYSVPAVVLGWRFFRGLEAALWVALLVIGWGGSALATLLFTTAFAVGNPTVVILLQKTQPLFAIALAAILLRERLGWAYWPCFAVAMVGAYMISFGNLGPFTALGSTELLPTALALGAALLWGSSTVLGRLVLKDVPFYALTGARLLLAVPLLAGIVVAQSSVGGLAAGPHRHQGLLRDARGVGLPGNGGRPQLDVPRGQRECKPAPWLRPPLGSRIHAWLPERPSSGA